MPLVRLGDPSPEQVPSELSKKATIFSRMSIGPVDFDPLSGALWTQEKGDDAS